MCSIASSSSAPNEAPGSSATRSTASSSTTPRTGCPPPCDLYERALSLGSMSKTYGLPGLRLGWLASRDRDALRADRRSQALHDDLLERSERAPERARSAAPPGPRRPEPRDRAHEPAALSTRSSTDTLTRFSWVRPTARPIGFVRLHGVDETTAFCEQLVTDAGVLLLPGAVYDEPGPRSPRIRPGGTCPRRSDASRRWLDTRS